MIEYLYDAVRASAGQSITVSARITDDEGALIDYGCELKFYDKEKMLTSVEGILEDEVWNFIIPAEATKNLNGRHFYSICHNDADICFKKPLYLI